MNFFLLRKTAVPFFHMSFDHAIAKIKARVDKMDNEIKRERARNEEKHARDKEEYAALSKDLYDARARAGRKSAPAPSRAGRKSADDELAALMNAVRICERQAADREAADKAERAALRKAIKAERAALRNSFMPF